MSTINSLQQALVTQGVCTVVTNAGLEISGQFTRALEDASGNAIYLQTTGPTRLAYRGQELAGHGVVHHSAGFGSPIGRLRGMAQCLSSCTVAQLEQYGIRPGQVVTLQFESGVTVTGVLDSILRRHNKNLVLTFTQCTVTDPAGDLLFDPGWGVFDMAVGDSIR